MGQGNKGKKVKGERNQEKYGEREREREREEERERKREIYRERVRVGIIKFIYHHITTVTDIINIFFLFYPAYHPPPLNYIVYHF